MATQFLTTIESIVIASGPGQLERFRSDRHFALRVANGSYMPLSIEAWAAPDSSLAGNRRISVCHYGEQNGDLMRDPEITMLADGFPLTFQNDYMGYLQEVIFTAADGRMMKSMRAEREQRSFLVIWAKNLREQGFRSAAKEMAG
jgi:hypothetical protein